jgi:putative acetyltransferase
MELIRTNSLDPNFIQLTALLDVALAQKNGDKNAFFTKYNKPEDGMKVVLAYEAGELLGCGAIKPFNDKTYEVKRMYVVEQSRKRGIALTILNELERWAKELGNHYTILETGGHMHEAVALYRKAGYSVIPNYPPYDLEPSSLCFMKELLNGEK